MKAFVLSLIGLGAAASATLAAAQDRLPRECRMEIRTLCGNDRSALRSCIRDSVRELSAECRSNLQEMRKQRGNSTRTRQSQSFETISYGAHDRQAVDFYEARANAHRPPLILFVHGGGWTMGGRKQAVHEKAQHFTRSGYAFASTGYRVLPNAPVEEQARDVAAAIAQLRGDANELNFDPDKIVLMGHSAGAHLAALVAADPQFAQTDFDAIAGVVLLDGAGYDVPAHMSAKQPRGKTLYRSVFGNDSARQKALSPITHVGGRDATNWLILHVDDRASSADQSQNLGSALLSSGASARVVAVPNSSHSKINHDLGKSGDFATGQMDKFLADMGLAPSK